MSQQAKRVGELPVKDIQVMLFVESMTNHFMKITDYQSAHYFQEQYKENGTGKTAGADELVEQKRIFREQDMVYYIVIRHWCVKELAKTVEEPARVLSLMDGSVMEAINIRYSFLDKIDAERLQERNESYISILGQSDQETIAGDLIAAVYERALDGTSSVTDRDFDQKMAEMKLLFPLLGGVRKSVEDMNQRILGVSEEVEEQ